MSDNRYNWPAGSGCQVKAVILMSSAVKDVVSEKIHGMGQNKTWFSLKPVFLRISGDDAKTLSKRKKKANTMYSHVVLQNQLKTYQIILITSYIFWLMMKRVNFLPNKRCRVHDFFKSFLRLFIVLFFFFPCLETWKVIERAFWIWVCDELLSTQRREKMAPWCSRRDDYFIVMLFSIICCRYKNL